MGLRGRLKARLRSVLGKSAALDRPAEKTAAPPKPSPRPPEPAVSQPPAPAVPPPPSAVTTPAQVPTPPAAPVPIRPANPVPPVAAPRVVSQAALLLDDSDDAPVRNAHHAPTATASGQAHQVRVYSEAAVVDLTFACEPGETVLDAAERAGHDLPYSCRGGGCLSCSARRVRGSVEMDEQYVLDEDHIADDFVLLCVTTVSSDAVFESHVEDEID